MIQKTHKHSDLDCLLHPAAGYEHPLQVLQDVDLTKNEKRALLAAWASDVYAVEAEPSLRYGPAGRPVAIDDLLDALRALDYGSGTDDLDQLHAYRRVERRRRITERRNSGQPRAERRPT